MNPKTVRKLALVALVLYALFAVVLSADAAKVRFRVLWLPIMPIVVPVIIPLPD